MNVTKARATDAKMKAWGDGLLKMIRTADATRGLPPPPAPLPVDARTGRGSREWGQTLLDRIRAARHDAGDNSDMPMVTRTSDWAKNLIGRIHEINHRVADQPSRRNGGVAAPAAPRDMHKLLDLLGKLHDMRIDHGSAIAPEPPDRINGGIDNSDFESETKGITPTMPTARR